MGERARALSSRFQRSEGLRRLTSSYAELDSPANGLPPLGEARADDDAGPANRPRVLVAVTGGGFYREAQRAAAELHESFDVCYVTLAGVPYQTLWPELVGKCYVLSHYDIRRCSPLTNAYRLPVALWQAYRILGDRRIRGVLTAGVNLAIPLGIAARLRGVPAVFVESISRVTRPSVTGRMVSLLNLADRIYVQWPEAIALYRRARYEGNIF
jgi:UDP-N-acetylglucosamine:LPS N-acetylglucosamine transferase